MNASTNVVDFGAKLAARRSNAPALQEPLLNAAESAAPVAAKPHARPSRSPRNDVPHAATLFESREVQTAPKPAETAAAPSSADAGSRKPQACEAEEAQPDRAPSPASSSDAAIVKEIATRGYSLSAVERDALLAQIAPAAFAELHADAERLAAATHAFLRALPERFEGFVRAKIVEIIIQRAV